MSVIRIVKWLAAAGVCSELGCLIMLLCGVPAVGQQPAQPAEPKAGEERVNPKDGATMVYVPSGEFLMGSTDEDIAAVLKAYPGFKAELFGDEKPQRRVYLDGHWIYKYEVTVAQYRKFCEATGQKMPPVTPKWGWKEDHPMVFVTWNDAVAYAKWAGVRLPTEAQWEKAARGTDGRTYPWGNQWDNKKCNNWESGPKETTPVGSFPAGVSPYGAHDMAGNVWEWCQDWYDAEYYAKAPARNPTGPATGVGRVLRGGSWANFPFNVRCALRNRPDPALRTFDLGFRCGSSVDSG